MESVRPARYIGSIGGRVQPKVCLAVRVCMVVLSTRPGTFHVACSNVVYKKSADFVTRRPGPNLGSRMERFASRTTVLLVAYVLSVRCSWTPAQQKQERLALAAGPRRMCMDQVCAVVVARAGRENGARPIASTVKLVWLVAHHREVTQDTNGKRLAAGIMQRVWLRGLHPGDNTSALGLMTAPCLHPRTRRPRAAGSPHARIFIHQ